jgi:hypothetical protein
VISLQPNLLLDLEKFKTTYPVIPEITAIRTAVIELFHKFCSTTSISPTNFLKIKRNIIRIFKLSYQSGEVPIEKIDSIKRKLLNFEPVLKEVFPFHEETIFPYLHTLGHQPHRFSLSSITDPKEAQKAFCHAADDFCLQLKQFASVALLYLPRDESSPLKIVLTTVASYKKPSDFMLSQFPLTDPFKDSLSLFISGLKISESISQFLTTTESTKLSNLKKAFLAPTQKVATELLQTYQKIKDLDPS